MYPFERFTERAKKVLTLAQGEAQKANHSYIGTEHLLLGLVQVEEGVAAKALNNLRVGIDNIRPAIESVLGRNERIIIQQIIPTSRVKKVIEISFEEARRMGHNYVGTEHMLLGLLIEGEGVAAHVLNTLGATLDKVRFEISSVLAATGVEPGGAEFRAGPKPREVAFRALPDEPLMDILDAAQTAAGREGALMLRLDHLLAAMVRLHPGVTGLLRAAGANPNALRRKLKPPRRVTRLEATLSEVRQQAEQAAAAGNHDQAAQLRAREDILRDQIQQALESWQGTWSAE